MPFRDRADAGRRLAEALARYKDQHPIVLALPRGGVPVAAEVARILDAPVDLILVRKIGVPYQPELAMGAVVDGPEPLVVRNEDIIKIAGVSETEFGRIRDRELAEIQRRRSRYLGDRPHPEFDGQVVIVIDDGVATGATTRAALRAVRARNPKRLILAVPVAPTDSLQELSDEADDIVCLEDYESFMAIGVYYSDFRQVSDEEVTEILARFPAHAAPAKTPAG
jgi:predicted phosphoribosyltransferase